LFQDDLHWLELSNGSSKQTPEFFRFGFNADSNEKNSTGNTEHGNVQLPLPTPIFYKRGPKQIFLKQNNLKSGDF